MLRQLLFRFAVIFTIIAPSAFAQVRYLVTDLGTLPVPGDASSIANGINSNGQVAGFSCPFGIPPGHAFIYSNGIKTALPSLIFNSTCEAYAINNNGKVAGHCITNACFWDGAGIHNLGVMGGSFSSASGINDNGDIVGYYGTNGYGSLAFLYTNGVMIGLGTLGGTNSSAGQINNAGQITGWAMLANGYQHAFLYSAGTMTDLGTLGGTTSIASGINQNGQIVGSASLPNGQTHAFLYSAGTMIDLGSLPGDPTSQATSINTAGQIVGYAYGPYPIPYHAFIYDNGIMTDLNNLTSPGSGWTLSQAFGINDKGQIVGLGTNPSHQSRGFLLTPYTPATLTVGVSNSDLVLSWPTNTQIFNLFQNSALTKSNWVAVTNTPTVTNGQNQVVIAGPLVGNCFFRLQSQ